MKVSREMSYAKFVIIMFAALNIFYLSQDIEKKGNIVRIVIVTVVAIGLIVFFEMMKSLEVLEDELIVKSKTSVRKFRLNDLISLKPLFGNTFFSMLYSLKYRDANGKERRVVFMPIEGHQFEMFKKQILQINPTVLVK